MTLSSGRLLAAAPLLALLASCGGAPPALPRTGLEDLDRLAGDAPVAPVPRPAIGASLPAAPGKVTAAELAGFRADEQQAMQILVEALSKGGGRDSSLEGLPAGTTKVERLARGQALLQLGLADQAAVFFQDLIRDDPRYLPARNGLGVVRLRQRRPVEAMALLEEVVSGWPDHAEAGFHLALAELTCGRPAEAEARLSAMIPDGPYAVEATRRLAGQYQSQRRFAEAKEVLDRMLRARPGQEDVIFLRVILLAEQGDFDAAAEELQRLAASKPARAVHLLELARLERSRGRFAEAEEALARAQAEGSPEDLEVIGASTFEQLATDLARERKSGQRVSYSVREVRAILRSSKDRGKRLQALNQLANATSTDVVRREVTEYLSDPDPEIRRAALRLLAGRKVLEPMHVKAALADADGSVRASAAPMAGVFRGREAVEVLLASLQKEEDPVAFRALHDTLRHASGTSIFLEPGAETQPERRAAIVEAWFERLSR